MYRTMASNAMTRIQMIFRFSVQEPNTALSEYFLNVFKFWSFVTSLLSSISQKLTPENVLRVSILPPILSNRD